MIERTATRAGRSFELRFSDRLDERMAPPTTGMLHLIPSRRCGRLLHRTRSLRRHHQGRMAAVLRGLRDPGAVGVEAHARSRRRRHLGRCAHPGPTGPRGYPLHDVLGISDRMPASARGAGCVGTPRARRQLRRASGLALSARHRPIPGGLVLYEAGARAHRGARLSDRLDSTSDDGAAADRPRRLRLRHAQGLDRLRRGHRHRPSSAGGLSIPTVRGVVRVRPRSVRPRLAARGLLLFVFAWKLGTEALRPLAGEPVWEFIERGGSYGAPLALAWLRGHALEDVMERSPARDRSWPPCAGR